MALIQPTGMDQIPPPSTEKTIIGDRMAYWLDTENFTIQWNDPGVTLDDAEVAAESLERSWAVLVDEHGWVPPRSSESHLLWAILDPLMDGTGLTVSVPTDAWPEGLPVIYLNPRYREYPQFYESVSAHEFGHALQFRHRQYYDGDVFEAWYWEATSEWMAEIVGPEWDQYAWSSNWYAIDPGAPFHSMEGFHQYGMMLVNAYLDEFVIGSDGIWDLWQNNTGQGWRAELEGATGESLEMLWADFAGSYGGEFLRESHLYEFPEFAPMDGEIRGELGAAYIDLGRIDGRVSVEGGIGTLITADDWIVFEGEVDVPEDAGSVRLAVTRGADDDAEYAVEVLPAADTDEPSGNSDDASGGSGGPEGRSDTPKKSGCSSNPMDPASGWWLLLGAGVLRRRRGSPAESPPR